jgi:hypothetical protein
MPETLESSQTSETQSTESAPQQSVQDQNRQALYEQYYGSTGGTQTTQETAPPAESTAQVEQVEASVVPPAATLPPEIMQLMQQMSAELAEVKAKLTPAAPTVNTEAEPEPGWIKLLREGRVSEAEDALADAVARKNQQKLVEDSTNQTREIMRAENEIDRFTTELRTANADLVPLEKLIAVDAQERMAAARAAGQIKTTDDAIRIYKTSVTEAVASARKLYQRVRGDGKEEAQVRQREVLSSRPITPQQPDLSRSQNSETTPQEPPTESPQEYLEKRRAIDNWRKGLAPKPNFL